MKTIVTLAMLSLACSGSLAQAQSSGTIRFEGVVQNGDEHGDPLSPARVTPGAPHAISLRQNLPDGARHTHSALLSYYSGYAPANAELINITYR